VHTTAAAAASHLHEHQALQQEVAAEGRVPELQIDQAAAAEVFNARTTALIPAICT
jgi:hypothetical protein